MIVTSKRPKYVALVSLVLSVIFFGTTFFLGQWGNCFAITAVSWFFLSVALVWLVLCIQFHQRSLAEQEKLDMSQLAKDKQSSTIFQAGGEQAALLSVAQRRLDVLEKYFIPIFSAFIAIYQIVLGLYFLNALRTAERGELKQPLQCAIFLAGIAFASFLMSRYATGMSVELKWKPLRAGGSYMLGAALLCFALAILLAIVHQFGYFFLLTIISIIILCLLVFLGIETTLNIVLDIYRPRLKGQYSRSAFDSRLLGVINEPGGILRSAADAIDYQFGFKVSQTWFYKLLEQAVVPLVLFGAITLYLLSCIVVVSPNEEAIIERFGKAVNDSNDVRLIGPGLTFKWPWPVEIAYKYPTKRILEIGIGYVEDEEEEENPQPKLWGKPHYKEEYHLLVSSESGSVESDSETVPVSLVIAAVPVQYRIKDLYSFLYNYGQRKEREGTTVYTVYEAEEMLKSICYRELTRFAASAKIELDVETEQEQSILGRGRAEATRTLTERIQDAADQAELGVEIVFLGLQGIHPPVEVAADYQKVISAIQESQTEILEAQKYQVETLGTLIGSESKASELYDLALKYEEAEDANNPQEIERLGQELDKAFNEANGEIFQTLREAQTYAFEKETIAEADGKRFGDQLKAYRAAPEIYLHEQRMAMLEKTLKNIRKYVVVADQNDTQITIIDLQQDPMSLYDAFGESSEQ